jgi:hypothetical protein
MTDEAERQFVITLMAEWETGPFWVSVNGGVDDPYAVDEIGEVVTLSDVLLDEIRS